MGSTPIWGKWNICSNLYINFFALVSRQSAVISSATQHAILPDPKESEDRIVLTLGFLCLLWCVQDTTCSWFDLFNNLKVLFQKNGTWISKSLSPNSIYWILYIEFHYIWMYLLIQQITDFLCFHKVLNLKEQCLAARNATQ